MYEVIIGLGTNVHILWGLGLLGLLIKICMSLHMRSMIKGSENMATTRKRSLRIMRQKYLNGRNLGINRGNGESFVEKNVRRLKWAGLPLELWRRSGIVLCVTSIMLMSGSFIYYETRWRGSPEMVTFFANGIMVCAFLIVIENIFLINNKMEILKANIRDYLENLTLPPPKERMLPEAFKEFGDLKEVAVSKAPAKVEIVEDDTGGTQGMTIDNEKVLDSFLKEFFC